VLFLSESDVEAALEPRALVAALSQAFVDLARDKAVNPRELRIDDHERRANFVAFPAYAPTLGAYAVKVLSGHHGNPPRGLPFIHAVVVLIDPADGRIVAVMAARGLTAMRTAATSALATKLLARPGSSRLAVIGTGVQARAHLMLFARVIDIAQITVCSSSGASDRARRLADEVGAALNRQVHTTAAIADAVAAADIVVTCTHAPEPLFGPEVLAHDAHLSVVGGFRPGDTEVAP
jgi:ornithine cyclodeaminase/alanine dehydrogenase-like protein (mu-crystallin family)